jgi:hypothetical protein
MRPPQKNRGNRNKGGRGGGGGPKPMGNVQNRVFESAGPEGKVRGTPQQIIDKYLILARDAQTSGDRVMAENFLQHAEHYIRLLSAAQAQMEERRQQQGLGGGRSDYDDSGDDDDGDGEVRREQPSEAREPRRDDREHGRDHGGDDRGRERREDRGERRRDRRDDDAPRRPEADQAEPAAAGGLATIDASDDGDSGLVATPENRAEQVEEAPKKRAPRRRRRPAGEGEASAADADDTPRVEVG